jgi:hypothetical protein
MSVKGSLGRGNQEEESGEGRKTVWRYKNDQSTYKHTHTHPHTHIYVYVYIYIHVEVE